MFQLIFRILFILADMLVNYQTLITNRPAITALSMDYVPFIVLFNAAMIIIICAVDYAIVKWRSYRSNYKVGKGLTDLYQHEH